MIKAVRNWFRPKRDDEAEFLTNLEKGTLVTNADEILVDGNGFVLRYGNVSKSYTHAELDDLLEDSEITDEEVIRWLSEGNEKRQVANPDYLPYDRREGF